MNRADLYWCLTATLPHLGRHNGQDALILETSGDRLYVHAMDGYTIGIARSQRGNLPDLALSLSAGEAKDLRRFVKPTRVAHRTKAVTMLDTADGELHVGIADDSAVFDCGDVYAPLSLRRKLQWIETLESLPGGLDEWVADPGLLSRFAEAENDGSRLRLHVRAGVKHGVAVVTVGPNFLGAVAGIEYEQEASPLGSWFTAKAVAA